MYHTKKQIFNVLEAQSLQKRSMSTKIADHLTVFTSTPAFLFGNIGFFVLWILLNTHIIPGVEAFDPYPFGFLTMIVSLEAIVLSIFVLISQNRAAQIATLREELHLRINQIAEQEVTKCLELLSQLRKASGVTQKDDELEQMLQQIDPVKLEESIQSQLLLADKSLVEQFLGNTLRHKKNTK